MKNLLIFILSLLSLTSIAQGPQSTISVPIDNSGGHFNALLYLPFNYTTAKKYPLLICLHGAGEAQDGGTPGIGVAKLYANTTSNAAARLIATGSWPDSFKVGGTGAFKQFIVVSPQSNTWGVAGTQLPFIIANLVATYSIDTNQIVLSGISAGGEGLVDYVIHNGVTPRYESSFIIPMSEAHDNITQVNGNTIANDSVKAWGFGDPNNDIHGEFTQNVINFMNNRVAGIGRFTSYNQGHCCWLQFYTPTYKEVIGGVSMNIYERALMFSRASTTTPTATAGNNQTITLPTSSVTVSASGSTAGTGHTISSYSWSKMSGPTSFAITSPSSQSTTITGLVQGTYDFKVTVTNDASVQASADVIITVNPATAIVANAGPDQTITLPTSSTSLSGSASTGGITSYAWTQLSGPNIAVLGTPNVVNTTAGSMIAGTYTFQLSVNSGVSLDQVVITVKPANGFPACRGTKFNAVANADTGWVATLNNGGVLNYRPGDTIVFSNHSPDIPRWVYIDLEDFQGNPSCPLVIINGPTGQTLVENLAGDSSSGHNGTMEINNSTYVKVTGSGAAGVQYGFKIEGDPIFRYDLGSAMQVIGRSHAVEVERIFIHNEGTGIWSKNNGSCDSIDNYPTFVMDSINIHDNKIVGTWNEGMYIGNTSPDNAPADSPGGYDPRPITCADTIFYPIPPRVGDYHVHHNIVDSTGRGGIQMASASTGTNEIDNNTVMHCGLNGDDAQGTCISTGAYTVAYIHDNILGKCYTWSIALLGASGTGRPQRIENNTTDSSGYQSTYDLSNTTIEKINPVTQPMFVDSLPWPQSIFVDTKPTFRPVDSTIVWIRNNILGLAKGMSEQILIQNDFRTLQLKGGNIICNNTIKGTSSPSQIFIDPTAAGFVFSSSCSAPPLVNAGPNQALLLPTNSVILNGTATGVGGATIASTTWTVVSGSPNIVIVSPSSLVTNVTSLIVGTYVFQLSARDSNGNTTTSQTTVTLGTGPTGPTNRLLKRIRYTHKYKYN